MTDVAGSSAAFEASYRVRFDEAGPDGRLRTSGLLRYTQDLAAQHSAALGYDRAWYAARGLTWLVRAAEFDILGPMPYGVEVRGTTRVIGFRRVWSRRESTFRVGTEAGAVVPDRLGAPRRAGRADPDPVRVRGLRPRLQAVGRLQLGRVALDEPPTGALRHTIAVRPQELDPLDHVNNAVYADWLDEAVLAASESGTDFVAGSRDASGWSTRWLPSRASGWKSSRGTPRAAGRAEWSELPTERTSSARGWKRQGEDGARRETRRRRTFRGACRLRRCDRVDDAGDDLRDPGTILRSTGREPGAHRDGIGRGRHGWDLVEYPVPAGSHPHDVAPAADGGVWYTGQRNGTLGHLDPATGEVREIPLGDGFGAARRDRRARRRAVDHRRRPERDRARRPGDRRGRRCSRCRPSHPDANLNTAAFDGDGVLWFTGQTGIYGRLDPATGEVEVVRRARAAAGRTASPRRPTARSGTRRWPAATSRASTSRPARRRSSSRRPPGRARAASGRTRTAGSGSASGTPARSASTTRRTAVAGVAAARRRRRRPTPSTSTTATTSG